MFRILRGVYFVSFCCTLFFNSVAVDTSWRGIKWESQRLCFCDLGIELQEVSGLCPWAGGDYRVQKHPIFKAKANGIFAWHVEIDGDDIEFVTEPFSYDQKDIFHQCIHDIRIATCCLLEVGSLEFNFQDWINVCRSRKLEFFDVDTSFGAYSIRIPQECWRPTFAPQITVKHPLEWTIPLYVAMTMSIPKEGNRGNKYENPNELLLQQTIPFRSHIRTIRQFSNNKDLLFNLYHNKLLGLMFINALTMESIGNLGQTDDEALKDLFESSQLYGQFDAKMRLMVMSRRPFSQMYLDIGGDQALSALITVAEPFLEEPLATNSSYVEAFRVIMMSDDNGFKDAIESFNKANYGEQYYRGGSPLKLSSFKSELSESFLVGQNKAIQLAYSRKLIGCTPNMIYIDGLLNNGIIITTMLRNLSREEERLQKYFGDQYYRDVIESVSRPGSHKKRIVVVPEDGQVRFNEISYEYDLLSPPVFLDEQSDSMGHYKRSRSDFGEALVEIRMIQDVGDFFIGYFMKLQTEETKGSFLKEVDLLSEHAVALLDGLYRFEDMMKDKDKKEQVMGMLSVLASK